MLSYASEKRSDFDNNKVVAAPFRDLSEAFDTISHEILLENLEISGFDQIAMRLIKSYLSNKTQKVVVQNTSSELIDLYLRLITTFYLKKKVSVFFSFDQMSHGSS